MSTKTQQNLWAVEWWDGLYREWALYLTYVYFSREEARKDIPYIKTSTGASKTRIVQFVRKAKAK